MSLAPAALPITSFTCPSCHRVGSSKGRVIPVGMRVKCRCGSTFAVPELEPDIYATVSEPLPEPEPVVLDSAPVVAVVPEPFPTVSRTVLQEPRYFKALEWLGWVVLAVGTVNAGYSSFKYLRFLTSPATIAPKVDPRFAQLNESVQSAAASFADSVLFNMALASWLFALGAAIVALSVWVAVDVARSLRFR